MSALSLDKPLPSLPLQPQAANENDIDTDVPLQELEGYIDMLAYLRRDLPIKPEHTGSKPSTPTRQPLNSLSRSSPQQPEQDQDQNQDQDQEQQGKEGQHQTTIIIAPPIREDEWLSPSRSHSRQSTAFTSYTTSEDDMLNRARSRSAASGRGPGSGGAHLHSASASRRTVTPMSSMGSDGDLRGATCTGPVSSHATANSVKPCTPPGQQPQPQPQLQLQLQLTGPTPARIDEEEVGSEPGTGTRSDLDRTPVGRRRGESSARDNSVTPVSVPTVCWHCGRDPSGRDAEEKGDSPATVLEPDASPGSQQSMLRNDVDMKDVVGPGVGVEDEKGQSFAQRAEATSFCRAVEEEDEEEKGVEEEDVDRDVDMERNVTPEIGLGDENAVEFSSPFIRPANPDPYLEEDLPSEIYLPRHLSQDQLSWNPEAEADVWMDVDDMPPSSPKGAADHESEDALPPVEQPAPYKRAPNPDPYSSGNSPTSCEFGPGLRRSFWKNPEGVILVYEGVEMNGDEMYYGNDINYLGSFYDDDEGSSGLGSHKNSTVDLHGAGSGLAVIPEGGSSDDMWDDEVFVTQGAG